MAISQWQAASALAARRGTAACPPPPPGSLCPTHLENKHGARRSQPPSFRSEGDELFERRSNLEMAQKLKQLAHNTYHNNMFLDFVDKDKHPDAGTVARALEGDSSALSKIATKGGGKLQAFALPRFAQEASMQVASAGFPGTSTDAPGVISVRINLAPGMDFRAADVTAAELALLGAWARHRAGTRMPVPSFVYRDDTFRDAALLKSCNPRGPAPNTYSTDVHGLLPERAVVAVWRAITVLERLKGQSDGGWMLQVVTGQGKGSKNKFAVLRDNILRWLDYAGIPCGCEDTNTGALIIPIGACPPPPSPRPPPSEKSQPRDAPSASPLVCLFAPQAWQVPVPAVIGGRGRPLRLDYDGELGVGVGGVGGGVVGGGGGGSPPRGLFGGGGAERGGGVDEVEGLPRRGLRGEGGYERRGKRGGAAGGSGYPRRNGDDEWRSERGGGGGGRSPRRGDDSDADDEWRYAHGRSGGGGGGRYPRHGDDSDGGGRQRSERGRSGGGGRSPRRGDGSDADDEWRYAHGRSSGGGGGRYPRHGDDSDGGGRQSSERGRSGGRYHYWSRDGAGFGQAEGGGLSSPIRVQQAPQQGAAAASRVDAYKQKQRPTHALSSLLAAELVAWQLLTAAVGAPALAGSCVLDPTVPGGPLWQLLGLVAP
ncbi:MAG: hypothetical protein J3K34DRAFT_509001 [Monoraphidium minutum]|nr:MAG: hypothetical protein J3K34DRAFT_509001 [Monoraphidium minutum]